MNYYLLEYEVVDDFVAQRAPYRDEHLRLVRAAYERGELVMAGAAGEPPAAAVLVFRNGSPAAAEAFARTDPYVIHGLVRRWHVRRWHVVVP
jgi:hypothetical protein